MHFIISSFSLSPNKLIEFFLILYFWSKCQNCAKGILDYKIIMLCQLAFKHQKSQIISSIAESDSTYCDICYRSMACLSIWLSVTHANPPFDIMRFNLARTLVWSQVTVTFYYIKALVPDGKRKFGVGIPSVQQCHLSSNYSGPCLMCAKTNLSNLLI